MKKASVKRRAVTLQNVADKAGVGLATASYVLNNKPKALSDDTRARVWSVAREIGYRPNMAARSLVTQQTHLVALWIPHVATAFSSRVIAEIQKQARTHAYDVMICDTQNAESQTTRLQLPQWNVDGVIAFFGSSSRQLEREAQNSVLVPTISMGAFPIEGTDFVGLDLFTASRRAVQWMHEQSRRHIAFLVPEDADFEGDERREAYLQTVREKGDEPIFIHMDENSRASAYASLCKYLQENAPPDGLFCYNDYTAIGASRALREAGLQIPAQVLVIGCDGLEDLQYLDWPLHTIELPIETMCATAWEFLRHRLKSPDAPTQNKLFQGKFIISTI